MQRLLCTLAVTITLCLVPSLNFGLPHRTLLTSVAPPAVQAASNLALNKPATQSSTAMSAGLAVDGNTDGNYFNGSVSHTLLDNQAWWQVDLTAIDLINTVEIYNRTDCCPERLSNYYVFVSDVPFVSTDVDTTVLQPEVSSYFQFVQAGNPTIVSVNRMGRYIRIQLTGANFLHMAEVRVMGTQLPTNPAVAGQWGAVQQLPDIPVHMSLLPSGKLLFWGRDKRPDGLDIESLSNAYLWEPVSNTFTAVPNQRTNLFCSGHAFLPDGKLFVAGGREIPTDNNGVKKYELEGHGPRHTNIFDYATESWSAGPDMRLGRWYPTVVTLPSGEALVVGGNHVTFNQVNSPQFNNNQDTEILGLDRTLRTTPDNTPTFCFLCNYPFAHVGPDGNVSVVFGQDQNGVSYIPSANSWSNAPDLNQSHNQGTSVMYDRNDGSEIRREMMVVGGLQPPSTVSATTEVKNLAQLDSSWTTGASMTFPRYFATSVLLPDGRVFVVGGSRCYGSNVIHNQSCTGGAIMNPEIYNPDTQNWSIMARQQVVRMYHSVALLMPDARILVAGGGRPGAIGEIDANGQMITDIRDLNARLFAHKEAEIFSPPYLFNANGTPATRPAITNSPSSINYTQSFSVGIGNMQASQIEQVVLVRLPSVTHGLNFDQRRVVLSKTLLDQQTLSVTAPANGNECPPGPYMLFVLGPNGVPSVAKMILMNIANNPPPPPSGLVATALSNSQVSITWTGSGVPVHHYELERSQSIFGPFTRIGRFPTTSFTDSNITGLAGETAYLYRVRAVDFKNIASDYSNIDLATTMSFTDNPLVAGSTIIQAQHINELRIAVNAVRATAGLVQASWTDPFLTGVFVKAVHINELHNNLNPALQSIGLPIFPYTDVSPGMVIRGSHVEDIRQAVR